jgi:hypothetical protein
MAVRAGVFPTLYSTIATSMPPRGQRRPIFGQVLVGQECIEVVAERGPIDLALLYRREERLRGVERGWPGDLRHVGVRREFGDQRRGDLSRRSEVRVRERDDA